VKFWGTDAGLGNQVLDPRFALKVQATIHWENVGKKEKERFETEDVEEGVERTAEVMSFI
jgi:hypothetical protein